MPVYEKHMTYDKKRALVMAKKQVASVDGSWEGSGQLSAVRSIGCCSSSCWITMLNDQMALPQNSDEMQNKRRCGSTS